MIRVLLGILGAVAALLYWRYVVFVAPLSLSVLWSAEWRAIVTYAVAGFVLGSVVGFVLSKIGRGGY